MENEKLALKAISWGKRKKWGGIIWEILSFGEEICQLRQNSTRVNLNVFGTKHQNIFSLPTLLSRAQHFTAFSCLSFPSLNTVYNELNKYLYKSGLRILILKVSRPPTIVNLCAIDSFSSLFSSYLAKVILSLGYLSYFFVVVFTLLQQIQSQEILNLTEWSCWKWIAVDLRFERGSNCIDWWKHALANLF